MNNGVDGLVRWGGYSVLLDVLQLLLCFNGVAVLELVSIPSSLNGNFICLAANVVGRMEASTVIADYCKTLLSGRLTVSLCLSRPAIHGSRGQIVIKRGVSVPVIVATLRMAGRRIILRKFPL